MERESVRRPFVESAPLSQARSRLDRLTFAETHFVTTDFLLFNMRDLCRAALKKTVFFSYSGLTESSGACRFFSGPIWFHLHPKIPMVALRHFSPVGEYLLGN
jgi:hypothetical protein